MRVSTLLAVCKFGAFPLANVDILTQGIMSRKLTNLINSDFYSHRTELKKTPLSTMLSLTGEDAHIGNSNNVSDDHGVLKRSITNFQTS